MGLMYKEIIFSSLIIFLLVLPHSFAQEAQIEELRTGWVQLAGGWLIPVVIGTILLFLGGIVVHAGRGWGKWIYILGLIVIFGALFAVEAKAFEVLSIKKMVSYTECVGLFPTPSTQPTDPALNILGQIACVLGGYMPSGNYVDYATFFIFAVITPLALLVAVSLWALDFVHPTSIRNVIAFSIAFIGFRGLFVTLFIEFLTFGAAGILALIVNMLLIIMLWRLMVKFLGFAGIVTQEKKIIYMAALDRALEEEKDILRALELSPNDKTLRTRLEEIREYIQDIKKEAGKEHIEKEAGKRS